MIVMGLKILGITDRKIPVEMLEDELAKTFPDSERTYVHWDAPETDSEFKDLKRALEKDGATAVPPPQRLAEKVEEFDPEMIITHAAPVPAAIIERGESLQLIGHLGGGGQRNVDIDVATDNDILVLKCLGRSNEAVSDYTIGMILAETRNIARAHDALKEGRWRTKFSNRSPELRDCVLGVVGFGGIGRRVAQKANALGMRVLSTDPYVSSDVMSEHDAEETSLDTLLERADVVTLHVRITDENEGLIGEEQLEKMRSDAFLINTGRAGLVERDALYEALNEGEIDGAALDVFWDEPLSLHSPFLDLDNVTLTPHQAGAIFEEKFEKAVRLFADQLTQFFEEGTERYVLNDELLENQPIDRYRDLYR